MAGRGWRTRRTTAVAGVAAATMLLVACGNDAGAGSGSGSGDASTSPSATAGDSPTTPPVSTPTAGPSGTPTGTPSAKPSTTPTGKPTRPPVETPTPAKPVRLVTSMLLTGGEVSKADPKRGWAATEGSASTPICGRSSTRGEDVAGALSRNFTTGLDASGGQWLTRYKDAATATTAYNRIVATIKSCKAARPAPTHARKLTENRTLPVGQATTILRWYDYPLPSDPGSEDGGFPYAVTRQGAVVSVLAFREMGKGVKPANFERLTRAAAAHLG
ncbi:hypothetical protein FB561_1285 [Kribbella amoyensis]|uniref:PknH-like protein n=1 Tax=Kribbella amoyensis TaxID=996641 RepID=A0A561BN33_9ACTN|nr:hypothetical protein [Kribbella amoyensis]TWD80212.1 hypothetical protein FB561_1285 [Kribbella amoyensis]